ncbi:MAG: flippase-like domain-containing protein [Erythrobacter sp.]
MTHETPPEFRFEQDARSDPLAASEPEDTPGAVAEQAGAGAQAGGRLAQLWQAVPRRSLRIALYVLPVVALGNVAVLVWSLGGVDLAQRIVAPELLGLAAVLVFVPMLANAARLAIWSRFMALGLGFGGALKVITGTMVTNSVTPSATGGMPIKLLFLVGAGVESRRAVTLISFQAAEDAVAAACLIALCLGFSGFAMFEFLGSDPALLARIDMTVRTASLVALWSLAALALLALVTAGGLLGKRVRGWAARVGRRARGFLAQVAGDWRAMWRRGKLVALANLSLALLQWGVRFSIAGLVLAAFGVEWHPALYWLLQYLVQSISAIVPTPGGAGGAEAGFLLLFAPFAPVDALVPAMSAWRLLHFFLPLAGAALVFVLLHRASGARLGASMRAQPAE